MNRSVSKKKRFDVFKRDGFSCQYCGAHPPEVILEADHIVAVADGGSDDETNLITACFNCNRGKGAGSLTDVPRSLSERATETLEREEQIAGYETVMRSYRERVDYDAREVVDKLCDHHGKDMIPKKDFQSIKHFIERIGFHEVITASEIAISKKPHSYDWCFRYFCGICWNKIREAQ